VSTTSPNAPAFTAVDLAGDVAPLPQRVLNWCRAYRWILLWATGTIAFIVFFGVPASRPQVFAVVGFGLIASTAGTPRSWTRVVVDWAPLFVVLSVYDILRGIAGNWLTPHTVPQIRIDEFLFGGTAPTVALQHAFYTPGVAHVWDYVAFYTYMTHFFASFVIAAYLWKFAYPRFRRYVALFLTLTFAAFTTYLLYPAVPPWLASHNAQLAPTSRIIDEMWEHVGLADGAKVFSATSHFANPVAAVPSLHAAYTMLIALFFWNTAKRWRWLLVLYPILMGLTLVYTGEHYVFDILLGWLYAVVVYVVGTRVLDRRASQREAKAALALDDCLPAGVTASFGEPHSQDSPPYRRA
jgi:membrane-associated phospholipid phosphatase